MNKGFWNRLLKCMKNDELSTLFTLISNEQNRRADKRIREGKFAVLEDSELELIQDSNDEQAIAEYMKRTNCPAVMARKVVKEMAVVEIEAILPEV